MSLPSSQRRPWSKQQDEILKQIVSARLKINPNVKWSQIADELNRTIYTQSLFHRNTKQCRERWSNCLRPDLKQKQTWTPQQSFTLLTLYKQNGHKWSKIASSLQGRYVYIQIGVRSENSVKNYFYSSIRKVLRKINNPIKIYNKTLKSYLKKNSAQKNLKPHNFQSNSNNLQYCNVNKSNAKKTYLKQINSQAISKLLTLAQQKQEYKLEIKDDLNVDYITQLRKQFIEYLFLDNNGQKLDMDEELNDNCDEAMEQQESDIEKMESEIKQSEFKESEIKESQIKKVHTQENQGPSLQQIYPNLLYFVENISMINKCCKKKNYRNHILGNIPLKQSQKIIKMKKKRQHEIEKMVKQQLKNSGQRIIPKNKTLKEIYNKLENSKSQLLQSSMAQQHSSKYFFDKLPVEKIDDQHVQFKQGVMNFSASLGNLFESNLFKRQQDKSNAALLSSNMKKKGRPKKQEEIHFQKVQIKNKISHLQEMQQQQNSEQYMIKKQDKNIQKTLDRKQYPKRSKIQAKMQKMKEKEKNNEIKFLEKNNNFNLLSSMDIPKNKEQKMLLSPMQHQFLSINPKQNFSHGLGFSSAFSQNSQFLFDNFNKEINQNSRPGQFSNSNYFYPYAPNSINGGNQIDNGFLSNIPIIKVQGIHDQINKHVCGQNQKHPYQMTYSNSFMQNPINAMHSSGLMHSVSREYMRNLNIPAIQILKSKSFESRDKIASNSGFKEDEIIKQQQNNKQPYGQCNKSNNQFKSSLLNNISIIKSKSSGLASQQNNDQQEKQIEKEQKEPFKSSFLNKISIFRQTDNKSELDLQKQMKQKPNATNNFEEITHNLLGEGRGFMDFKITQQSQARPNNMNFIYQSQQKFNSLYGDSSSHLHRSNQMSFFNNIPIIYPRQNSYEGRNENINNSIHYSTGGVNPLEHSHEFHQSGFIHFPIPIINSMNYNFYQSMPYNIQQQNHMIRSLGQSIFMRSQQMFGNGFQNIQNNSNNIIKSNSRNGSVSNLAQSYSYENLRNCKPNVVPANHHIPHKNVMLNNSQQIHSEKKNDRISLLNIPIAKNVQIKEQDI